MRRHVNAHGAKPRTPADARKAGLLDPTTGVKSVTGVPGYRVRVSYDPGTSVGTVGNGVVLFTPSQPPLGTDECQRRSTQPGTGAAWARAAPVPACPEKGGGGNVVRLGSHHSRRFHVDVLRLARSGSPCWDMQAGGSDDRPSSTGKEVRCVKYFAWHSWIIF